MSKEVNYLYHSRNSNTSMTPTEILLFANNNLHASIPATPLNKIKLTSIKSFIFHCRQDLASWNVKLCYGNWFSAVVFDEIIVTNEGGKHVNSHSRKYPGFYLPMVQLSIRLLGLIQGFESCWVSQRPSKIFIHVL